VSTSAAAARLQSGGLRRKIWIAFILQVAAISFATVLGVYGASAVLQDVLIHRALVDEAAHYWRRFDADPGAELPDTFNMKGHLHRPGADAGVLPEYLHELEPGYHSLPRARGGTLVYVEDRPAGRLFLEFKQEQVTALAFFFGAVPLVFVLIVIYVVAWATYRLSRRAVSPVIWLAEVVQKWDPKHPDIGQLRPEGLPIDVEGEVEVLANALHSFGSRISGLLERERNFTRDASHELRTPLTVIHAACELLEGEPDLPPHVLRTLVRIRGSAMDMEALIGAFLLLAREDDSALPNERVVVNTIVREELDRAEPLVHGRPVELVLREDARFCLLAPSRVLAVVLSNLIRNACAYTSEGTVTVVVGADFVRVGDTGEGMSEDELARVFDPFYRVQPQRGGGHGLGLAIVQRLAERFDWRVSLHSRAGVGTSAQVRFPSARQLPQDTSTS
jgi:signal transduction histidine kinase